MPIFNPSTGPTKGTSTSLEQYIEAIADLLTRDKVCSVSEIAEHVQVSRPAASRAVRELAQMELVDHKAYGYVDLTAKGQSLADRLTAREEALHRFLKDVLLYDDDRAEQEACRLEHQVDDEFAERINALHEFITKDSMRTADWARRLRKEFPAR